MPDQSQTDLRAMLWVLGALAMAVLVHSLHLPIWVLLLAGSLAAWRLLTLRYRLPLPPRLLLGVLAGLGFAAVLVGYRTINGLEAGTALLVLMMSLKIMEAKTRRDQHVLLFIAYFLVMAGFLYTQEIWAAVYLFMTTWVITTALLVVGSASSLLPGMRAFRGSLNMLLQALPLMLIVFVLFPRIPGPFWALPTRGAGVSGLGDEMSPGTLSSLSLSDAVAFRVTFDEAVPPPEQRYWRGPVLSRFDGRTWRGTSTRPLTTPDIEHLGNAVAYRITLQPHNRPWLFALDMPATWSDRSALMTRDYQLVSSRIVDQLRTYNLESYPQFKAGAEISDYLRGHTLDFGPAIRNARSRAWATQLRDSGASDLEIVSSVLRMFREQPFFYTLEPPPLGMNSVDEFLWNTRAGFCEHYASSFTFLMRAAGIPARVITGYQGGEINPLGGHLTVRQSDAHAWSEIWLQGQGWVRVDPTTAVAPERVERNLARAMRNSELVAGMLMRNIPLLDRLRLTWDMINSQWNEWVLGYGPETQFKVLESLGLDGANWRQLVFALGLALIAFLVVLTAFLTWQFRPRQPDAAARLYDKFCRKAAKAHVIRQRHEAPVVFAERLGSKRPDLEPAVTGITNLYVQIRYEPNTQPEDIRELRRRVSDFNTRQVA